MDIKEDENEDKPIGGSDENEIKFQQEAQFQLQKIEEMEDDILGPKTVVFDNEEKCEECAGENDDSSYEKYVKNRRLVLVQSPITDVDKYCWKSSNSSTDRTYALWSLNIKQAVRLVSPGKHR